MTSNTSVDTHDKTVCIYDYGLFVSWAEKLTESFGRVLYFCPWQDGFPTSRKFKIGQGLPGVERVEDFWGVVQRDEADLYVFPDVFCGDIQEYLRSIGKYVWGCGLGEELELYRWETKQLLKQIGLPVQHVERVIGIENLKDYLRGHEDKYVKVSLVRGDMETWHHINYELSEPRLDEIETRIGANKFEKEFVVEDAIHSEVEVGYDGFTIDGKFPQTAIQGYEIKDVAYAGCVRPYSQLPWHVQEVNARLSPIFQDYGYKGFWSSEIRVPKDNKPYLIDLCCRAGSPPSEVYQELVDNWAEVMWWGARGELVDMHPTAKYGVEVLIHSSWADAHWAALYAPPEIHRWIKLRNMCRIDDTFYVAPQTVGLPEIGAVVGVDVTILGAIKKVALYCREITGYDIDLNMDKIPKAMEAIEAGNKMGIKFCDDVLPTKGQVASAIAC